MKKQSKVIILLLLLLLLIAGCGQLDNSLSERDQSPAAAVEDGAVAAQPQRDPAVDFTVQNAAGESVDLFDFVGQPIVVNLWASW